MSSEGIKSEALAKHQFTPDHNQRSEKFVEDLVKESVQKLLSVSSPIAVYLQGSFGRGEGTVLVDEGGEPKLWRDLDLVAVYQTRESSEKIARTTSKLNELPGVNPSETPIGGSYISIAQLPIPLLTRWRDLKMYEFATNSLHLYGQDIRPGMAVIDEKIPIESGERFLLQKCMGLCKAYPYIDSNPEISNYEVSKTYIEISSALALKAGQPSAHFEERLETLCDSDNPAVRDLVSRIERWGEYKIKGQFDVLGELPAQESWIQARDDLFTALAVLHDQPNDELPYDSELWLRDYYKDLSNRFLSRTFTSAVSSDWPPRVLPKILGSGGSYVYRLYSTARISDKNTGLLSCPLSAVYVASIATLATLEKDEQDAVTLNQIQTFLNIAGGKLSSSNPEDWISDLDDAYLRAAKPLYGMG